MTDPVVPLPVRLRQLADVLDEYSEIDPAMLRDAADALTTTQETAADDISELMSEVVELVAERNALEDEVADLHRQHGAELARVIQERDEARERLDSWRAMWDAFTRAASHDRRTT